MDIREQLTAQLPLTLDSIDIPELGSQISGKVRDCYVQGTRRYLIASDRLSAFDKILTTIPFKGQILSQLAGYWFRETASIVPNHIISQPHPNVFVCEEVQIIPVEVVIRGYLAGSAWRDYQAGRPVSGITLPSGMRKSERFPEPLITPSTKAPKGEHDLPISSDEVVRQGIVDARLWDEVCRVTHELFRFATTRLAKRGLLLVDTKFEFGVRTLPDGSTQLVLADEVLTPDSSRFWVAESYDARFAAGEDPEMLDKEFVRRWLIERGYMGDGVPPQIPDDFRVETAVRYIDVFERITGTRFQPQGGDTKAQIRKALLG